MDKFPWMLWLFVDVIIDDCEQAFLKRDTFSWSKGVSPNLVSNIKRN